MSDRTAGLAEYGLCAEKVGQLLDRIRRDVAEGRLPAAQVVLARHGRVAVAESYGAARNDSLVCLFSATKSIVYSAAWLLFQDGKLAEEELVADIIPEFAPHGKDQVSVRQLFAHTSGFPHAPFAPLQWNSKQETLGRFAQWRLNWAPGSRYEYHPTSSMWVIAEIIERRGGLAFGEFIRKRVLDPLGLRSMFVGLPEDENNRVLPIEYFGEAMTAQDYRSMGMPVPPKTEISEEILLAYNRPEVRAVGVPGAGGFANAIDLALFYQALLHGGLDGKELWTAQTRSSVRDIRTGNLRDTTLDVAANRGLGIILSGDADRPRRGFGKTNSPLAFGHNGAGGQLAWADPATGLSFACLTPGHDRNYFNQMRRGVAVSSLAAECAS